jgi:hypothetical protein
VTVRSPSIRVGIGLTAAIAVATTSAPTVFRAQQELDERLVAPFVRELQRAVARDDRNGVAAQIQYPLIVEAGGIRIPIADAAALLQTYDVVFSPALKATLADAAIPARGGATPRQRVTVAGDKAIVGDDLIWIQAVGGALKITRVSPLSAAPSPAPPADRRSSGAVNRPPRRLALQVGQVQLAGVLAPGARDAYVVSAAKNQLLEVRINGVSGRAIVARIMNMKRGAPVDARARDGVRAWSGRVPEDAEYRVDVVRLAPAGDAHLPYVIVVSIR